MRVVHFLPGYIGMVTYAANLTCYGAIYVQETNAYKRNTYSWKMTSPIIEDPVQLGAWIVSGFLICRNWQSPLAFPDDFVYMKDIDSRRREWLICFSFLSRTSPVLPVPQTVCIGPCMKYNSSAAVHSELWKSAFKIKVVHFYRESGLEAFPAAVNLRRAKLNQ